MTGKSVKFQALTDFMRALMAKHANDELSRVENPECTNNYRVKAKQMEANFPALLLRHLPAYLNARSSQNPNCTNNYTVNTMQMETNFQHVDVCMYVWL